MNAILSPLAAVIGLALSATVLACDGNISIGEGESRVTTTVPNRPVGGRCLNDLIVDTAAEGANHGSHGAFVLEVSRQAALWAHADEIDWQQWRDLVAAAARSDVGKTMRVRVIAFNDFHGNIDGGALNWTSGADGLNRAPAGGVDYMAGLVRQLRRDVPDNVVVSAGDLIGASPLNSALFHDEPAIETMNRLGLDFNAVGNHEFDEGRDELLRMQQGGCHPADPNSCMGNSVGTPFPFEGAKFDFLAANVVDSDSGKTLFPAYGLKNFKGNRVAFIGMTLEGTPSIVTPSGVAGLAFRDEADTVNELIGDLKRKRVESIVVLLHEGGIVAGGSISGCAGVSGPIVDIVGRLDDAVDLVVSGHTNAAYNCLLPNRAGRAIPVTSAGSFGRLITSIDMTLDTRTRDVIAVSAANRLVDRNNVLGAPEPIQPVREITNIVANYNAIAAPIANRVIGAITADITRATSAAGESALGDVIADAQLAATRPAGKGAAAVAFMNPGGIRADLIFAGSSAGEGDGNVTYGETFTVQPFGNSLVVKTLSGRQIYDLLEQQWSSIQPFARILQVSGGFSYRHTFGGTLGGTHVCDGSVTIDGVPVDKDAAYRVTMNSFLATGGDNFSVFNLGTEQIGGDVDVDAMEAWFNDPAADGDTASPGVQVAPGPRNRIQRVAACS